MKKGKSDKRGAKSKSKSKPEKTKRKRDRYEDDEDNQQLYCICRKPDNGKVMIACDECDEWFHVECIGISKDKAQTIQKYVCAECRGGKCVFM